MNHDSEIGDITTAKVNLWLQSSVDVQPKDRFVSSGEKWIINTVDAHSFPALSLLKLMWIRDSFNLTYKINLL